MHFQFLKKDFILLQFLHNSSFAIASLTYLLYPANKHSLDDASKLYVKLIHQQIDPKVSKIIFCS